jgi:hypothetical protein
LLSPAVKTRYEWVKKQGSLWFVVLTTGIEGFSLFTAFYARPSLAWVLAARRQERTEMSDDSRIAVLCCAGKRHPLATGLRYPHRTTL